MVVAVGAISIAFEVSLGLAVAGKVVVSAAGLTWIGAPIASVPSLGVLPFTFVLLLALATIGVVPRAATIALLLALLGGVLLLGSSEIVVVIVFDGGRGERLV
eukprot:460386_1